VIQVASLIPFQDLDRERIDMILSWRNHVSVRSRMFSTHEISKVEHAAFIEKLRTDKSMSYWLYPNKGVVSLRKIDRHNGHAFLGIYKNPESSEKGIASELMRSLLAKGFDEIGLHTIKLEVFSDNPAAVNFYNKHGFNQEGRLREFLRRGENVYADLILMGITRSEYRTPSDSPV
jgi:UDP-4-amino-4,6-dideoxy-N-acetyl-beta-L-altrosamine N-acetyltransferase